MQPIEKTHRRHLQKKKAKFFTLKEKFKEKYADSIRELDLNSFKFYRTISSCNYYNVDGGLPISDSFLK
jgi:hypothetical protein